jgi:hypothetical protein
MTSSWRAINCEATWIDTNKIKPTSITTVLLRTFYNMILKKLLLG